MKTTGDLLAEAGISATMPLTELGAALSRLVDFTRADERERAGAALRTWAREFDDGTEKWLTIAASKIETER